MALAGTALRAVLRLSVILACLLATPAVAQFPDIRQMSGTPLPSPQLPDGTVSVRVVRESLATNLTGVTVSLEAGGRVQSARTDEEGRAIFSGVPAGATVRASVTDAGEQVQSQTFTMPSEGGIRLILAVGLDGAGDAGRATAGDAADPAAPGTGADGAPLAAPDPAAPAIPGRVVLGSQTRTIVEIIDGALEVFHVFEIANVASQPVDVGDPIEFALPEGARTVTLLEGSTSQARVFDRKLVVAGPFPPGRTMAQVAYRLSYGGPATSFGIELPLPMIQTNVIARLVGDTKVTAPVLEQSRVAQAEGRTYWTATGPGLNAGDELRIALDGLPYHSRWPRYTALTLAALVVAAGLWLVLARPVDPAGRIAALEAQRARLLDDVRQLDAQVTAHSADAQRRAALLQELEGVYVLLDAERERTAGATVTSRPLVSASSTEADPAGSRPPA